ncbi:MAG: hypothetical protein HY000_13065 [Planctomycetes bacterium]|nr:hypothetical protein [Planctomycetota bacterium]
MGAALTGGRFNQATGVLELDLDFMHVFAQTSADIGFNLDLGPLSRITSSSQVGLQAEARLRSTLGIDLDQPIGAAFMLSRDTQLAALNGPDGTTVVYDHQDPPRPRWEKADRPGVVDGVSVTLSNGTSFDVLLDGFATLGQVVDQLNAAAAATLGAHYAVLYAGGEFARIDVERKVLVLVDKTRGEAGPFSVTGVNSSLIGLSGVGLGIYSTISEPNDSGAFELVGTPLHNDGLAQRVFLVSTPANRPTVAGTVFVTAADIDATARVLFDDLSLGSSLDVFADGLDGFFTLLDTALDNQAFIARLPLIGDALGDAVRFVGDLRDKIYDNLQTAGAKSVDFVQQKIYEALGPGGLGWLRDRQDAAGSTSPAMVSVEDVIVSPSNIGIDTDEVQFDVRLKQASTVASIPIDFDLGLPLLGLEVDGQIEVQIGFEWDLVFGVSRDDGFFIVTGATGVPPEMKVTLDVTAPGLAATGMLGFLQVDATNGTDLNENGVIEESEQTGLNATILVDLKDPSGDGRLTLPELASVSNFEDVVQARFSNDESANRADVNLHLVASFGGNVAFPTIEADFNLAWPFNGSSAAAATMELGRSPSLAFNNVTIMPGAAISEFLGPVLDTINDVLDPVRPAIDVLTKPLPIISELAGRSFTLLDLAEIFGVLPTETREAADELLELADRAATIVTGRYNLGDFVIVPGGSSFSNAGAGGFK